MKLNPIIVSLLETDMYKFSMGQAIYHQFSDYKTTWTFKCRNKDVHFTEEMVEEIREQIKHFCTLRFTEDELDYLENVKWMKGSYVDFLRLWQARYADFKITTDAECGLSIETFGTWLNTSLYEIPTLAIVNEVYFRMAYNYDELLKSFKAEILTMIEYITANNIEHPAICVAFTPDEEIGMGTQHFDVERFGADYAYTVDGDTEGEIQYENFNAAKAEYVVKGFNVHPGSSKDTMINASLVAMEINNCLPAMEIPRETENYEGFYHLISMSGDVAEAHLNYIIRDHDASLFEAKKATLCHIEKIMNEKWGAGTVQLTITDQYRNMAEIIKKCMFLIENAVKACKNTNIPPLILPIRGGTDGCMLSYMGLPCPNLGTGGHAYHGPYEHITIEGMDKTVDMLVELVKTFSKPIIN